MTTVIDPRFPLPPERKAEYGAIEGLSRKMPLDTSIELFRRIALVRKFEHRVKRAVEQKHIECFVYLCAGQESFAASLSILLKDRCTIVAQHRQHGIFLNFGGNPDLLIDELFGLETGCCKGMGGAPSIHDMGIKMWGHNHLIGDNVPVACGISYAQPNETILCVFGDGAAEEDYVMGALAFAATHKLKMLFICDDNDLSVLTPIRDRRTWNVAEFAKGLGMPAVDISDDPWLIHHWAEKFLPQLPAVINIRNCRELWHNGVGSDGPMQWDRYELIKQELRNLGVKDELLTQIERESSEWVERKWEERLQKRFSTLPAST